MYSIFNIPCSTHDLYSTTYINLVTQLEINGSPITQYHLCIFYAIPNLCTFWLFNRHTPSYFLWFYQQKNPNSPQIVACVIVFLLLKAVKIHCSISILFHGIIKIPPENLENNHPALIMGEIQTLEITISFTSNKEPIQAHFWSS